jgi:Ni,Fe-hydrogenase maturation factor
MINHAPVHILCFGNLWHGDDGLGLHVLRQLRGQRCLPPHARTFDAGTAGLKRAAAF